MTMKNEAINLDAAKRARNFINEASSYIGEGIALFEDRPAEHIPDERDAVEMRDLVAAYLKGALEELGISPGVLQSCEQCGKRFECYEMGDCYQDEGERYCECAFCGKCLVKRLEPFHKRRGRIELQRELRELLPCDCVCDTLKSCAGCDGLFPEQSLNRYTGNPLCANCNYRMK